VFQVAIVDVDTGLVVATATSAAADVPATIHGPGRFDCIFEAVPLRRRHYVLRAAITDAFQLVSYDAVTAGPRFAVVAGRSPQSAADTGGDDEDGLIRLPHRFEHHTGIPAALVRNP
jgi:hypothetical protein